jgi:hypothetical protein
MYTKKEILDKMENGEIEEANDILLDFIEKLFNANGGEFSELKDEWYCDLDFSKNGTIDLTSLDFFDWNFFKEQSIDFTVEDEY